MKEVQLAGETSNDTEFCENREGDGRMTLR